MVEQFMPKEINDGKLTMKTVHIISLKVDRENISLISLIVECEG